MVGQSRGRGRGEDSGDGDRGGGDGNEWDGDGRCETEVWRGNCGGKLPTGSNEVRNEEMVRANSVDREGTLFDIRSVERVRHNPWTL